MKPKEKYTFGWHDPRSLYGEPKMFKEDKNLIFIYAGNAHIQNYVNFLEKYMSFKLVSGGVAHTKRCIDVKKLY